MIIYSGRHGNVGHAKNDIGRALTDLGEQQAAQTGAKLAGVNFDIVFSSPARRSRETANIIAPGNGIIEISELYPTSKDLEIMFKELGYAPLRDYLNHKLGKAVWDIGHDAQDRITDAIINMGAHHAENPNILIVSHAITANIVALFFSPRKEDEVCMDSNLGEADVLKIDTSNGVSEHIYLP